MPFLDTSVIVRYLTGDHPELSKRPVDALIAFIQLPQLSVDGIKKSLVYEALLLCRPPHRVSFADAFIRAAALRKKEAVIYSFDERFPGGGMEIRG